MKCLRGLFFLAAGSVVLASCSLFGGGGGKPTATNPGQMSTATGLTYNDEDAGGFQVTEFEGQPDAPNTVFIEGGRAAPGPFEGAVVSCRHHADRPGSLAPVSMPGPAIAAIHALLATHALAPDSPQEAVQAALPHPA